MVTSSCLFNAAPRLNASIESGLQNMILNRHNNNFIGPNLMFVDNLANNH